MREVEDWQCIYYHPNLAGHGAKCLDGQALVDCGDRCRKHKTFKERRAELNALCECGACIDCATGHGRR